MVAPYDLQPGNGAGPIFWKVRDRRRNRRVQLKYVMLSGAMGDRKFSNISNDLHSHPTSFMLALFHRAHDFILVFNCRGA